MPGEEMICPFCGESDFDIEGLRHHITGFSVFSREPLCPADGFAEEINEHLIDLGVSRRDGR